MKRLLRAAALLAGVLLMAGASEAQTGLLEAAARGDLAAVNRLIAAKADLEQRDGQRQTPLLLAVAGNHVAVAKALLAAGASPNAQAANQDTPWLLAGASGRTEIIAAMLPLKPDLTIRNRYGGNALIPACERAHVETAKLLLTSGIDVNHVNNLGWTALLEAVILGDGGSVYQEIVGLLVDAGAKSIPDRDGVTPLEHARRRGFEVIAARIAAGPRG